MREIFAEFGPLKRRLKLEILEQFKRGFVQHMTTRSSVALFIVIIFIAWDQISRHVSSSVDAGFHANFTVQTVSNAKSFANSIDELYQESRKRTLMSAYRLDIPNFKAQQHQATSKLTKAREKKTKLKKENRAFQSKHSLLLVRDDSQTPVGIFDLTELRQKNFSKSTIPIVIHSIPFNGEPMSLLTIAYLYEVVDFFIIVEGLETFSGNVKSQYQLDKNRDFLEYFRRKIIEVRIDKFPTEEFDLSYGKMRGSCAMCWCREAYIRNVVKAEVLRRFVDVEYMLIHADGDELPKKTLVQHLPQLYDTINSARWGGRANIESTKFTYSFKWYSPRSYHRSIFVVTNLYWKRKPSMTLDAIRHTKAMDIKFVFAASAWHCSSCLSIEDTILKLESFSHQEINKEEYKNKTYLENLMDSGKDLVGRTSVKYQSAVYSGQEGYPDLVSCPLCSKIPQSHLDILQLEVVAKRAQVKNIGPNYSLTLSRYFEDSVKSISEPNS